MQTFPLELDNALFIFNLVQYIPNWYPAKYFFINCIPFELTFCLIGLRISFWIFFSFSSFGTMILLLWFLIFKLLSIFKPNDFFYGMDAISKPLISEHLQRNNSTPNLLSYFCNQCLPIAFHESISLLIILYINFICLLLTKLSMLIIPIPPSLIFKQHTFLTIWFGLLSQRNFQIKSFTSFFIFIWYPPHFSFKSHLS